ncbi:MAG: hypothetical protein Q8L27_00540 [archaeon]|nr:hypothetical protein [archaeon]
MVQDAKYKIGNKTLVSTYVGKPFDEAKAELENKDYSIITPEQFAQLRIAKGASHSVSTSGAYTSMGDIMIPKKGRFLTPLSLVMKNPTEATQAHRNGKEFYVSDEDTEKALENSIVIPYNQSEVPFNRFAEDPITAFVFEKIAKEYGEFLQETFKEVGITAMPLLFDYERYINSQKSPFANQLWLHGLGGDVQSDLDGISRGLDYGDAVRGVKFVEPRSGEDRAKVSVPNLKEILKYSEQFVPEVKRKDFEKGLEAIFNKY